MHFDKRKNINLLEFIMIFAIFVAPPMLSSQKFAGFTIPEDIYHFVLFILKITLLAGFEELLYRLYLPFRIKTFFQDKKINIKEKKVYISFFFCTEFMPVLFFALAHRYLGIKNIIYAFFMGIIFRILYLLLKSRYSIIPAFLIIDSIHALHNILIILNFS